TWFELAHGRLVRPVQESNAAWREKNLTHFQREAVLWASAGRPDGLLLAGEALGEAERWAGDRDDLMPAEKDFLGASQRARTELERQQRQARLTRKLAIVSSAVSLLAVIALVFAVRYALAAKRELRVSRAQEIIAEAEENLDRDPHLSIGLARAAVTDTLDVPDRPTALEARAILYRAVYPSTPGLTLPEPGAQKIVFIPRGKRVVTAGPEDRVVIWDAASGRELHGLRLGAERVKDIAFSREGDRLAAAGGTRFSLWDVRSGKRLQYGDLDSDRPPPSRGPDRKQEPRAERKAGANAVALSPDGKLLAVGGEGASIWDVGSGKKPKRLRDLELPEQAEVGDIAFSPDGESIAIAAGGEVFIRRLDPYEQVRTLSPAPRQQPSDAAGGRGEDIERQQEIKIQGIAYNNDGSRLATLSADAVIVWETATGKELRRLPDTGDGTGVSEVTFSPDGRHIATDAGVWVATSGRKVLSLRVEPGIPESGGVSIITAVNSVAFSPDGRRLATAGVEATPAIRELDLPPASGHTARVYEVAFSPDGARLATASVDGTARVWDASSGKELLTLSGHTDSVN
ncbi:MAG: WD40 repeat domain-containing protein, partial [Actinomycetota bacterium]